MKQFIVAADGYWVDAANNKWSTQVYTKQEALEASESLNNCKGCINCSDCINCVDCIDCHTCVNCTKCDSCMQCKDLQNATGKFFVTMDK